MSLQKRIAKLEEAVRERKLDVISQRLEARFKEMTDLELEEFQSALEVYVSSGKANKDAVDKLKALSV